MKGTLRLILVLCLSLSSFDALPQPIGHVETTHSENGQFSVEVVGATPETRQINVFRDADPRAFVWGREIKWPSRGQLQVSPRLNARIDNSGEHVVLWDTLWNSDASWVFLKRGDSEIRVPCRQVIGQNLDPLQHWIIGSVDFVLDPSRYCFWLAAPRQWFVFDLKSSQRVTVDAALAKQLDEICRQQALEKIGEHRRGPSFLDTVRAKASSLTSRIAPPANIDLFGRAYTAYGTITQYRRSEDRYLLEELLQMRERLETYSQVSDGVIKLEWRALEASLADKLLSHWDDKIIKVPMGPGPEVILRDAGFGDEVPRAFLAELRGSVHLPFSFPARAGEISLYIIPNELKKENWFRHEKVVATRTHVFEEFARGTRSEPVVLFKIRTLFPGEYRCKAVWDRRRPSPPAGEIWVEPGPGDYESVESEPFQLTAGQTLKGVVLYCTNRVGDAPEYFAADDLWKSKTEHLEEAGNFDFDTRRGATIFTAPVERWLISSNHPTSILKDISVVELNYLTGPPPKPQGLNIRCSFPSEVSDSDPEVYLEDSHGCRFLPETMTHSGRHASYIFRIRPGGTMKFVARRSETNQSSRDLVVFDMTNAAPVMHPDWKSQPLPQRTQFGNGIVQLDQYKRDSAPDFTFFDSNGKPSSPWIALGYSTEDRLGNIASLWGQQFCAHEPVVKLHTSFLGNTNSVFEESEFLELTIPEIPAPGRYMSFGNSAKVGDVIVKALAVTGTGEFSYRNNLIVKAAETISPPGFPSKNALEGSVISRELFIKNSPAILTYLTAETSTETLQVVSKVPHLALDIRGLTSEHGWHVEGLSIPKREELSFASKKVPKFIPLPFVVGTRACY